MTRNILILIAAIASYYFVGFEVTALTLITLNYLEVK